MKGLKHLMVLAIALCAIPSMVKAQSVTVQAAGGGSSALFLELGQGAASGAATSTPCTWTSGKSSNILARDTRTSPSTDEQGNIWVTWSAGSTGTCASPNGTGINVYSYMQLDSVVGNKCYFMVDSSGTPGCVQIFNVAANASGANKLPGFTDTNMPSVIQAALNGQHFTYAGTDIRPEDAQFATLRMFTPCGQIMYRNPYDLEYRLTYGLGYQSGTPNVGLQVQSAFSGAVFNVINFNFSGPDPFNTSFNSPQFQVDTVGAQPIVVAVSPATDTTGIAAANDVSTYTLAMFYDGVLARSTDFIGPTVTNPVVTLVREPLSGTYNTFEFSVPNSSQFHKSQDDNFCNGSSVFNQQMNIGSSTGTVPGAARKRVIGTGEMTAQLQAASGGDTLGYFFWSAANANGLSNVKYLTVNGVDPLLDSYGDNGTYTPGALPQATPPAGVPPLAAVSFKNLNAGDYPVWSALRVIGRPGSIPVANILSGLASINPTQHDYIAPSNLKVWHAHFPIYGIVGGFADGSTLNPSTPGDLCTGGATEVGGDAGGANLPKQVNADYCTDYANPTGLVNQVN